MRDLTEIIDRIQAVRQARRRFLRLWRLERLPACLAVASAALDRLAADIDRAGNVVGDTPDLASRERIILKTRTTRLFPHGRLADEWE